MCVYQATQDGSWGLTFMICFNHGIRVLSRWRNSRIIYRSFVRLFQFWKSLGWSTLININSLPMGVIMLSKSSITFFDLFTHVKISLGVRPALPMGVTPEAIVKNLFWVYTQINCPFFDHQIIAYLILIISSGVRPALPMVVAPEAIVEYFWV
jgi:hypothetical protein